MPEISQPRGYTPEEAALLLRLRIFIFMRWAAIAGVAIAAAVAAEAFHIRFPLQPVYLTCGFLALYNIALGYQAHSLKKGQSNRVIFKTRLYSNIHIVLDLVALVVLVHFTGGIENPFIVYFVFHAIAASIVLNYRVTYMLATLALLMAVALVALEYIGWIPHYNLQGYADPTLYRKASYVLPVLVALATLLYGATYLTTSISGELRKRQRQVVSLANELLERKMAELEQASAEAARFKALQDRLSAAYHELSESHRKLRDNQEHLIQAEKLTSLGQLSASIAHEINNPLSGVLTYTQLLAKKLNNGNCSKEEAAEYLAKIESAVARSSRLVRNLLDFARQSTPALREVDVNEVVNRSLDLVAHSAELQHVKIEKSLATGLPRITADFDQLQQVCTNLMMNAVQAMPRGGNLTIGTASHGSNVSIQVRDTGVGIPQENLGKLFTPFFTTKKEIKGVGLGLAVSYGIIQRHRGRIEVTSLPNEGSTFTVSLPIESKDIERSG